MGVKKDGVFLKHIAEEVDFLIKESKNLEFQDLMKNEVLKRAFARSIEIIGEATKNLSDNFKNKYSKIEWKKLGRMRDKLIHCYFGVNWDIVWDIIKHKAPELKKEMDSIKLSL